MSNSSQNDIDEAAILSAIWILACNDENPFLLYSSTRFRLGLPESYDLEELIKRHGELFRQKCPEFRLEEWKQDMLKGNRQPLWIREIKDNKERKALINSLEPKDVFRSQFRANANAPRSEINIIDWGLEHIERLRKAEIEAREGKWKKWKEVWIPLISIFASILIAIGTILITSYWQKQNIETQKQIKELELTYKPKLEGYLSFLQTVDGSFDLAMKRSLTSKNVTGSSFELSDYFLKIDNSFYMLEPFLRDEKKRELQQKLAEYKIFLAEVYKSDGEKQLEENVNKSVEFSNYIKKELGKELFK